MKDHYRLLLFALLFSLPVAKAAEKSLKAASFELSPYISAEDEGGYLKDVVSAVFQAMGYRLVIEYFPLLRAPRMLEDDEADILIPAYLDDTKSYSPQFAYSAPILESDFGTVTMIRAKGETPQDLYREAGNLREQLSSDTILNQLDMLKNGHRSQIFVEKYLAAETVVTQRPALIQKLNFTRDPSKQLTFHVAFRKTLPNYQELVESFNKTLQSLKENGKIREILESRGYYDFENQPGTINIAAVDNPDFENLRDMSESYLKRHPGLKIRWNFGSRAQLRNRVLRSMTFKSSAYDLIPLQNYDSSVFASLDWLEPFPNPEKSWNEEDLLAAVKGNFTYKNQFISVPFSTEVSATYYRTDLFHEKNLKMPLHPTYAEIESFAAKLHNPEKGVYGLCMQGKLGGGENLSQFFSMAMGSGTKMVGIGRKTELNSSAWMRMVSYYIELMKKYGPPNPSELDFARNRKLFAEGRCAIWIDMSSGLAFLRDPARSSVAHKFAMTYSPYLKGVPGDWYWLWSLAVPKSSKNKAEAYEFAKWASSEEYVKELARTKGWKDVPSGYRLSTKENPKFKASEPYAEQIHQTIVKFRGPDSYPKTGDDLVFYFQVWPAIGKYLGQNIQDAIAGKISVKEALDKSQANSMRVMYQSGFYKPKSGTR